MITAANWFAQFLHPGEVGHGGGYWFWSGIGSDFTELAILGAFVAWWRTHNCHVHRCWRLMWHPHPDHGHPVCRHHHPDGKGIAA